jgi:hypothetical protein
MSHFRRPVPSFGIPGQLCGFSRRFACGKVDEQLRMRQNLGM